MAAERTRRLAGTWTESSRAKSEQELNSSLRGSRPCLDYVAVCERLEALGAPPHLPEMAERTNIPGIAVGLAVTANGGDILFVDEIHRWSKAQQAAMLLDVSPSCLDLPGLCMRC